MRGKQRVSVERILADARKTRNINIRIRENDLERLKDRAEADGIPYQTLIASVLHKFINERFVDERDIRKSMSLLAQQS